MPWKICHLRDGIEIESSRSEFRNRSGAVMFADALVDQIQTENGARPKGTIDKIFLISPENVRDLHAIIQDLDWTEHVESVKGSIEEIDRRAVEAIAGVSGIPVSNEIKRKP